MHKQTSFRNLARKIKRLVKRPPTFISSSNYWEQRYQKGGNSGSGSYNRLAQFKAAVLNDFVAQNSIESVIEFGSGDGAQLALARYPLYTGVDVSHSVIQKTRQKFNTVPNVRFMHTSELTDSVTAELSLSLDVIYHLVEDDVFDEYMRRLFDAAERFVIIYASNSEMFSPSAHVRHRKFTQWIDVERSDYQLLRVIPNPYPYSEKDPNNTSFADFYIFERRVEMED